MKKKVILGKIYPSTRKDKKYMVFVINPKTKRLKRIHFGDKNSRQNISKEQWKKFMKRSNSLTDGKGRKTKNNPLFANYWSRRFLWNGSKWRK